MATVWLMDVDGVFNVDHPGWSAAPYHATVYADQEYKLRWSRMLMVRTRRLLQAGVVDGRWCSTWCRWAHLLERAWSLPELARALSDDQCAMSPGQLDSAKLAAAKAVVDAGDRLIWTDDTAVPRFGPHREALERAGRALLIAPAGKTGLTVDHMAQIEEFAWRTEATTVKR